ncbi:uncharacterized protein LOC113328659 [Papaver somniferum]|uniref:uncharacterized protein LOC113328659 n=1 Tax=Papaver somniferum TaxID=3469 RepID=UPI000E6F7C68|nr:uncharacterized protein LOC113328659 [Papaver somniferum]
MTKALSAKGNTGYIGGTVKKPTSTTDLPHWTRCDDLVGRWISNYVDPSIQSSTMKQDNLYIARYYTNLKSLWDQLDAFRQIEPCICGAGKSYVENHNQDRSMEFLQGLHDRFSSLRSQILLMEPMPSPAKIYNHVRQEEEQQGINSSCLPFVESATINVTCSDNRNQRPFPNNGPNKRARHFCDHCNKYGHTRQTYWKLNGYPKDFPMPRDLESHVIAAVTQPATTAPPISAAQYARLGSLLEPENDCTDVAPYANFAGP